jgi:hypothetical protein
MEEKLFFMKTLLKLGALTVNTVHVPDKKLTSRLIVSRNGSGYSHFKGIV